MKTRFAILAALLTVTSVSTTALAHDEDLRSGDLRPRIGQMSDEVVFQRLKTAGMENPRIVRREGTQIVVQGTLDGRPTTLHMDALRAHVVDAADPSRVIAGPGVPVARPMVTGPQLRQERSTLSSPALMRDAVKPAQ